MCRKSLHCEGARSSAIICELNADWRAHITRQQKNERLDAMLGILERAYPEARCALRHRNPLELLIATMLSAQCTDEQVNKVTRELFTKYRSAGDYTETARSVLEEQIRPTGFYRNKAGNIQEACRMILEKFDGRVPQTMRELVQLPGVARKTANVVLGVIWGKAEGVVVDTHVFRIARRLELSRAATPEKVEAELMALLPRSKWIEFSHQLIQHGRKTCKARKPLCHLCSLEGICRSEDKVPVSPPSEAGRSKGREGIRR